MKKLYLVRHAKSSWEDHILSDHDRPLSSRGKKDAPKIAALLKKEGYIPDVVYSSSARRAILTAKIFSEIFGLDSDKIIINASIYDSTTQDLLNLINSIDDSKKSAMLFGHNPGFTTLANLIGDKFIDNMPTSAVAIFELNVQSWKDVNSDCGKLVAFEYPKKYE